MDTIQRSERAVPFREERFESNTRAVRNSEVHDQHKANMQGRGGETGGATTGKRATGMRAQCDIRLSDRKGLKARAR